MGKDFQTLDEKRIRCGVFSDFPGSSVSAIDERIQEALLTLCNPPIEPSDVVGTQLLSFSGMNAHDPTYMAIHDWPELDCLLHNEQLHFLEKHNLCRGSPSYPNWKMLQFQAPPGQPLLQNRAFSESGEDRTKTLSDRFSTAVCESDCALSLLSSPQSQSVIALPHQSPPYDLHGVGSCSGWTGSAWSGR